MLIEDDLFQFALSIAALQPKFMALGKRYKAAANEPDFVRTAIRNDFYPLVFVDLVDAYRAARKDRFANPTAAVTRAVANRLCAHYADAPPP
jgi:hypothetical protein